MDRDQRIFKVSSADLRTLRLQAARRGTLTHVSGGIILLVIPLALAPNQHPGNESVRSTTMMERMEAKLRELARIHDPQTRGAGVAVESITKALLTLDNKIQVLVPQRSVQTTREWMKLHARGSSIEVSSLEEILPVPSSIEADLWFDPAASSARSLRLRNFCSAKGKVPPLLSIQHTLSVPVLLDTHFRSWLSEPTFACDSLVCGSKSAQIAVRSILEHLKETQKECSANFRVDVAPLPIDTDRFHPGDRLLARKKFRFATNDFSCLYVGYLSSLKADWVSILGTFASVVSTSKKKVQLLLVGASDPAFAERVQSLQQQYPFLRVIGPVSADEKVLLYQAADLFFSPADTLNESYGLTPVEAMACGLPQLVSDWNGYRDTVVHGITGFRIDTLWQDPYNTSSIWGVISDAADHLSVSQQVILDHHQLHLYLSTMISNDALVATLRSASRVLALRHFSLSAVNARYRELADELKQIAKSLHPSELGCFPTTTNYFRCFSQYATYRHAENMLVSLGKHSGDFLGVLALVPNDLRFLLDPKLIKAIVLFVEDVSGQTGLGNVVDSVSITARCLPDKVWWHCCWLAKYGILRLSRPEGEPQGRATFGSS